MSKEFFGRELSACETLIMKAIWDEKEDIPLQKLMDVLREQYHKDYARTTVATFLTRLSNKGYVQTYRKGRISFSHPLQNEEEYKEKLIREEADFWFGGDEAALIAALCKSKKLSPEKIQAMHDALDNQ